MTGHAVIILIVMVGGVVLLGVVTQLLEGTSREWKTLAGRYPPREPAPDATTGEARIRMGLDPEKFWIRRRLVWLFMPWRWARGLRQVRYAVDDECLHLETEGGRLVARSGMSIPWGDVDEEGRVSTHMGEHALLRIGQVWIAFPSVLIVRELGLRAEAESMASDADADERYSDGVVWKEEI